MCGRWSRRQRATSIYLCFLLIIKGKGHSVGILLYGILPHPNLSYTEMTHFTKEKYICLLVDYGHDQLCCRRLRGATPSIWRSDKCLQCWTVIPGCCCLTRRTTPGFPTLSFRFWGSGMNRGLMGDILEQLTMRQILGKVIVWFLCNISVRFVHAGSCAKLLLHRNAINN